MPLVHVAERFVAAVAAVKDTITGGCQRNASWCSFTQTHKRRTPALPAVWCDFALGNCNRRRGGGWGSRLRRPQCLVTNFARANAHPSVFVKEVAGPAGQTERRILTACPALLVAPLALEPTIQRARGIKPLGAPLHALVVVEEPLSFGHAPAAGAKGRQPVTVGTTSQITKHARFKVCIRLIGHPPLIRAGAEAHPLVQKLAIVAATSTFVVSATVACRTRFMTGRARARCFVRLVLATAAAVGKTKAAALCSTGFGLAGNAPETLPRVPGDVTAHQQLQSIDAPLNI